VSQLVACKNGNGILLAADGKAIDFDVRGEMLDGDEITSSFTVPRLMRLEYKLNQLCKENARLDQILPEIRSNLKKQAETQEEVGEPFSYAFITVGGYNEVS
jgi:hypothetical protein